MPWHCPICKANNEEVSEKCTSCDAPKPADLPLTPEQSIVEEQRPTKGADFWIRVLARVIDSVIGVALGFMLGGCMGVLFYILAKQGKVDPDWAEHIRRFSIPGRLIGLVGVWSYASLAEGLTSTSIGKLICGLQVVDHSGRPIRLLPAFKRNLAYFWDSLFLGLVGYQSMKKSPLCQRYGDAWAGTIVVKRAEFEAKPAISASRVTLGICAGLLTWSLAMALELYIRLD